MIYKDNEQLKIELKKLMLETNTKQTDIANILGVQKQSITKILDKKHINFDDLTILLETMGYCVEFNFVKKDN